MIKILAFLALIGLANWLLSLAKKKNPVEPFNPEDFTGHAGQ